MNWRSALGVTLLLLGIGLGAAAIYIAKDGGVLGFLLAGVVASGAMQSVRYGRGLLVPPVSQAANDRTILLLRAFDDDALSLQRDPIFAGAEDTFEEVLARELEDYGNVVTVADPRRLMPLPGASRQHLGRDWQAIVRTRIVGADLVMLIMGRLDTHPGLRWELEALSTMGHTLRHALLLPPTLPKEERAIRWNQYNVYFGGKLGTFEGDEVAVTWDSGGSSSVIRSVPGTENDLGLVLTTLRAILVCRNDLALCVQASFRESSVP